MALPSVPGPRQPEIPRHLYLIYVVCALVTDPRTRSGRTSFKTYEGLSSLVEHRGNITQVSKFDLREAHGGGRLRIRVRREISEQASGGEAADLLKKARQRACE
jgi:hypothetical protein